MKFILGSLIILFLFMFPDCIEKGWKGISVLRTTRDEVEKILGQPIADDGVHVSYETEDALIHISYSKLPCSDTKTYKGSFNVQQNTVLQYQAVMKKEIKLSKFEWQSDLYQRVEDEETRCCVNYFNAKNGVGLRMEKIQKGDELVSVISFTPTVEQNALYRCENK